MSGLRSSLTPHAGSTGEPNAVAARKAARDAFHASDIVLIRLAWLNAADRRDLIRIAERVHGRRRSG
ncbi:hypothetical protein J2X47_001987 [Sphingomonas sp. BE270]|uniref:hypothetical protein n=1 Tax=Sphingomonas sp. BE270 TaxID=2817726 RepID=UPI002859D070|nr:hypothetical protein [Sphingomonas sp. BE270]MDR7257807.1 hypothetical protein [Sphingomonas sp. BE270]